ncbi:MAG: NUDIX domain-containing protein [Clostridia bacterium]|nr:NUDIX domain-containing protein [Clostridia bacterium]
MDELVDIFDENHNLITQEMKSIAHKNGLWHTSIHGFLVNSKNEILLQQRSKNKDLYPSKWDMSFSGHVSAGENTISSAIRECYEEIGIVITKEQLELLFTFKENLRYKEINNNEFVDVFLCKIDFNENSFKKQDEEVDDLKIIPLEKYIEMLKNNNDTLVPHYEEYKMLVPILSNLLKKD